MGKSTIPLLISDFYSFLTCVENFLKQSGNHKITREFFFNVLMLPCHLFIIDITWFLIRTQVQSYEWVDFTWNRVHANSFYCNLMSFKHSWLSMHWNRSSAISWTPTTAQTVRLLVDEFVWLNGCLKGLKENELRFCYIDAKNVGLALFFLPVVVNLKG